MSLVSCNKIREIRPTSFELVSVSPKGFYSADVDFRLGVHNPALQIGFSDIFAEVVLNGKVIGNVSVAPFVMEAKSDNVYDMNALLALNKGTSVLNLIPLLKNPDAMKNAHINLRVRATLKNGISKELVWNEVPVEKLIKLVE